MVKLFAAGGMIIDNVVTADGTVHREALGGNGVYAAAGARLWCDRVGLVALLPRNYPAHWLDALGDAGIDTAGVAVRPESVDQSEWFFYRSDGSRVDHLYAHVDAFAAAGLPPGRLTPAQAAAFEAQLQAHGTQGADFATFRRRHPICASDVPHPFRGAQGVHLAPGVPQAQLALAQGLHTVGRRITLDPGSHAGAMRDVLPGLLPLLDAFLPSEKELQLLAPGIRVADGLARMRASGAPVAVVKLAAAGAMLASNVYPAGISVPALPVRLVDPTGAGDAFCGGFLAGLVATSDPLCAVLCGTASASIAVESFGPMRLLAATQDEVLARWQTLARMCALPNTDQRFSELLALRHELP